jgi:aminoglycoside phosphotransferase (APT) family kinase protein
MFSFLLSDEEGGMEHDESLILRVGRDIAQMRREFDVIERLRPTAVPVPAAYDIGEDPHGFSFVIMEHVEGENLWVAGEDLTEAEQEELWKQFATVLAHLHALDWRGMGFDSLGPPDGEYGYIDSLLSGYRDRRAHLGVDALDPILDWMAAHKPPSDQYVLLHGDYHGGNVLADQGVIAAVVDWEGVSIGDAAYDVCWTPVLWRAFGVSDVDATDFLVKRYEEAAGRKVRHVDFYTTVSAVQLLLYMLMTKAHADGGNTQKPGAEIMLQGEPPIRCAKLLEEKTGIDISLALTSALNLGVHGMA